MLEKIIDAVSIRLREIFGAGYDIHQAKIDQGLAEPCFLIKPLSTTRSDLLGSRFQQANSFDIHYFPIDDGNYKEMADTGECLMYYLDVVTAPDGQTFRAHNANFEIIDGVLHFFVDFNLVAYRTEGKDQMETLTEQLTTKGVSS